MNKEFCFKDHKLTEEQMKTWLTFLKKENSDLVVLECVRTRPENSEECPEGCSIAINKYDIAGNDFITLAGIKYRTTSLPKYFKIHNVENLLD